MKSSVWLNSLSTVAEFLGHTGSLPILTGCRRIDETCLQRMSCVDRLTFFLGRGIQEVPQAAINVLYNNALPLVLRSIGLGSGNYETGKSDSVRVSAVGHVSRLTSENGNKLRGFM